MPNPIFPIASQSDDTVSSETGLGNEVGTKRNTAFSVWQVEHGFVVGDIIYFDLEQQRYKRADAQNRPIEMVAVVMSEHGFRRALLGERITIPNASLQSGAKYYASDAPGTITTQANEAWLGYAFSPNEFVFCANGIPMQQTMATPVPTQAIPTPSISPTPTPTSTKLSDPTATTQPSPIPTPQATPTPPVETKPEAVKRDGASIGMNLNGIAAWSTQHPFLDVFKTSVPWIPHSDTAWDTGEFIDTDAEGWVKRLPKTSRYNRVGTLMLREIPDMYEAGRYIVLYEGEGTIRYSFEASLVEAESKPGRHVINVTNGGGGIRIEIWETDPNGTGNYIRNIRVVKEEYETRFLAGETFNPKFLARLREVPLSTLRFMDWQNTNHSDLSEWSNRPKITSQTWMRGVPVEVTIRLCNELGVDGWWCMPHKASDDFVTRFATMVRDGLRKDLNAYVEYSNEVWNWGFEQATWSLNAGKQRWGQDVGDAHIQWAGMKGAQFTAIWKNVFASGATNEASRVRGVLATQTAWQGLEEALLNAPLWVAESPNNLPPYRVCSHYAITGYFDSDIAKEERASMIRQWMAQGESGFVAAIAQIRNKASFDGGISVEDLFDLFRYHADVSEQHNMTMVGYEWGTHILPFGSLQNDEAVANWCIALNNRSEIGDIYRDLIAEWKRVGGGAYCHFVDIGLPSKYGSWGALSYLSAPATPRWNALRAEVPQRVLIDN